MANFTLDSTLGEVLADPTAKALLEQNMPGMANNPMLAMISGMSLRMLLSTPQAAQMGVSEAKVQAILDQVNKAA